MGQKIAAMENGVIVFYDSVDSPVPAGVDHINISDAEWQQCLAQPGWIIQDGKLVAPAQPTAAELLRQAQQEQCRALRGACESAIISGFASSALGARHEYGSTVPDQNNLLSALNAAQGQASSWTTPLWCAAEAAWRYLPHSASQVQQVNRDWVDFRTSLQQRHADLVGQVMAATSVAEILRVEWFN
ncbi:hypothetical protein [Chromobacterium phragmitis]|uniref:DUF4376 domain-containing protein n=1 Tax=Chromobacterium phragmitis TaxID=2202141 RepID=A0ABV0J0S6_9NEIS